MIASSHLHPSPASTADCLVTGATGLVGNNVVRLLVDRNQSVRVLVRPGQPRESSGSPRQGMGGGA